MSPWFNPWILVLTVYAVIFGAPQETAALQRVPYAPGPAQGVDVRKTGSPGCWNNVWCVCVCCALLVMCGMYGWCLLQKLCGKHLTLPPLSHGPRLFRGVLVWSVFLFKGPGPDRQDPIGGSGKEGEKWTVSMAEGPRLFGATVPGDGVVRPTPTEALRRRRVFVFCFPVRGHDERGHPAVMARFCCFVVVFLFLLNKTNMILLNKMPTSINQVLFH